MEKNFNRNFGKNNGGSDDWNTPAEAVHAIAKVLKPNSRILCPFDKNDSNFVSVLRQYKLNVVNIPFAMLMNTNGLFDSKKRMELAINYGFQILYLYPRVKYVDCNGKGNSVPFQSCYVCRDVLAHNLMFYMEGKIYG